MNWNNKNVQLVDKNCIINVDNKTNVLECNSKKMELTRKITPRNSKNLHTKKISSHPASKTADKKISTKTNSFNLSKLILSQNSASLLTKGLKFIPSPESIPVKTIKQISHRLMRSIKLKDYFKDHKQIYDPKTKLFENKSTWEPKMNQISNESIQTIHEIQELTNTIINEAQKSNNDELIHLNHTNNLTKQELQSLAKLKGNKDIVIKKADKNNAIVLMNKIDYLKEADRQLSNTNYYEKLDGPIYPSVIPRINAILTKMKEEKYITQKQLEYLWAEPNCSSRTIYFLPKVHKPKENWPTQIPECRPIVSDVDSESYRVNGCLDYHINPLSKKHASYIKDTYDFLQKVRNQIIDKDWIIATGDVTSLYTNMNINRTLACVRKAFKQYPSPSRPDKHLLDLLEIILKNNDLEFNGEWFKQICGMGMGRKVAPALADLYLLHLDHKAMHGFRIKPILFFRFLDDIFFIWPGTKDDLKEYGDFLNTIIPGIKITLNSSDKEINFLDTTIYKQTENGVTSLQSKVYFKPTDTHQLLHNESFHPKHTSKSVLRSQLIRFKRISSTKMDYSETCKILFKSLKDRGYSRTQMRKAEKEIWTNYKEEERSKKMKKDPKQIFPLVLPYNFIGKKLALGYKKILERNKLFENSRIITAFTNHKNIASRLIRSRLPK